MKCNICLKEKSREVPFTSGHIIPNWVNKIGGLQEGVHLDTVEDESMFENTPKPSSAITSYLLCKKCDAHLGEGENEIKRVLLSRNDPSDDITSTIIPKDFPAYEIEVPRMHLFERAVAGILFKGQLMNRSVYKNCLIPRKKFKQLKEALLPGGSKEDNFDFLEIKVIKLYHFGSKGSLPMHFMKISGMMDGGISLFIAGLCIMVNYTCYSQKPKKKNLQVLTMDMEHLGYHQDRKFPLKGFPNFAILNKVVRNKKDISDWKKLIRNLQDTDLCPCGLHWTRNGGQPTTRKLYKECCKTMWFSDVHSTAGVSCITKPE